MPVAKRKTKTWDDYKDRYERPLSVRLSNEDAKALRAAATFEGVTTSQVLATLVRRWARQHRRRKRDGKLRASANPLRRIIYSSVKLAGA
jgi:uncharacterized protein (DUF1778 family)